MATSGSSKPKVNVSEPMDTSDKPDVKKPSGAAIESVTIEDIKEQCRWIERGEATKEPRFINRVLRILPSTRKRINANVLRKLIDYYFTTASTIPQKMVLNDFIGKAEDAEEDMDASSQPVKPAKGKGGGAGGSGSAGNSEITKSPRTKRTGAAAAPVSLLPEVDAYINLLVLLHLMDIGQLEKAEKCATALAERTSNQNRRSLDPISAKVYYYYSLVHEKRGNLSAIRDFLHAALRTATLRHDEDSQATLINCLLRSYLEQNLYDVAGKLVSKVTFPESANNNEWARFLYYLGRIRSMQLGYQDAHKHLLQALRKSPQHTAVGFRQTVQKLAIVVELLLGEIPERTLFRQHIYRRCLQPYLLLSQAVRTGDVAKFNRVLSEQSATFERDHTYALIVRLRQNVIRTAIKQIAMAYSRISIRDIQTKLQLSTADDAEYIVSKAIKDGAIEAMLNHDEGWMQSLETIDIYNTGEPQTQLHNRIRFCLEIYNQSVKDRREREQQDLEFAKEMAEDEDDFP